jgi:hypothetical protein
VVDILTKYLRKSSRRRSGIRTVNLEHTDVGETFRAKVCCITQAQLKYIVTQTSPHNHLGILASITDLDSTVWVNYELQTLSYC